MIPGLKQTRAIESVRIAIGEKGESGKKLPTKLSHFIFTTTQKKDGRYLRDEALTDLFGDKPKKIPIMLLSDDIETVLPTFYAKYSRRGMKLYSDDGEHWTIYNDDGTRTLVTCDPDNCEYFNDKDVKPHAILTGVIDCDSVDSGRHLGEKLFKFRTTSWNTMRALIYEMNRIKDACGGHLAYLPLNLIVFPKMVRPKGSASEVVAYVVSLEPRTTMADLRLHAAANARSLAMISNADDALAREAARISDPDKESIEEQIAVKDEFSPDPIDTPAPQTADDGHRMKPYKLPPPGCQAMKDAREFKPDLVILNEEETKFRIGKYTVETNDDGSMMWTDMPKFNNPDFEMDTCVPCLIAHLCKLHGPTFVEGNFGINMSREVE